MRVSSDSSSLCESGLQAPGPERLEEATFQSEEPSYANLQA